MLAQTSTSSKRKTFLSLDLSTCPRSPYTVSISVSHRTSDPCSEFSCCEGQRRHTVKRKEREAARRERTCWKGFAKHSFSYSKQTHTIKCGKKKNTHLLYTRQSDRGRSDNVSVRRSAISLFYNQINNKLIIIRLDNTLPSIVIAFIKIIGTLINSIILKICIEGHLRSLR